MGCQSHGSDSSFRIPILESTDSPIFSEKFQNVMDGTHGYPTKSTISVGNSTFCGFRNYGRASSDFEGFLDEQ